VNLLYILAAFIVFLLFCGSLIAVDLYVNWKNYQAGRGGKDES